MSVENSMFLSRSNLAGDVVESSIVWNYYESTDYTTPKWNLWTNGKPCRQINKKLAVKKPPTFFTFRTKRRKYLTLPRLHHLERPSELFGSLCPQLRGQVDPSLSPSV